MAIGGDIAGRLLSVDPGVVAAMRGNAQLQARNGQLNEARDILGVTTADWLGPLQPLVPFAPAGTGYRTWDYPVGINIRYQPRQEGPQELISYEELRFFSRNVDILRIIFENRKQQLARQNWQFVLADPDKDSENDPRIKELSDFFLEPDPISGHDFQSWMNLIVEEMLTTDAPAVFIQRDKNGQPYALRHVDGATIKVLIGLDGAIPMPPSPAYQQIIHGVPIVDLDRTQLFYYPRNLRPDGLYGYPPTEMIINTLNLWMRREIYRVQFYTEANQPAGLLEAPPGSTTEQIKELQAWINGALKGNTAERWNLLYVPSGTKFTEVKAPQLQDELDEWVAQIVCYCMGVPPTPFLMQRSMARANAESARQQSNEEGLAPLIQWFGNFVTRLVYWAWGDDYRDIRFTNITAQETDPAVQATIHKTYLSLGVLNINEVREDLGREPIEGGDEYRIYEATGPIPVGNADDMAQASLDAAQARAQHAQNPPAPDDSNQQQGGPSKAAEDNTDSNTSSGTKARVGTRGSAAKQQKVMVVGHESDAALAKAKPAMRFGPPSILLKKKALALDITHATPTRAKRKRTLRVL
jgi:hypothetical protein